MADGQAVGVPHWREYYRRDAPLAIYYPACGGGEECIAACPYGDKIWAVKPMRVPLFGLGEDVRCRPVMVRPDLCRGCMICVEACPTGALRPNRDGVYGNAAVEALRFLYSLLRLPFKKRYGLRWALREEHVERFKRNLRCRPGAT